MINARGDMWVYGAFGDGALMDVQAETTFISLEKECWRIFGTELLKFERNKRKVRKGFDQNQDVTQWLNQISPIVVEAEIKHKNRNRQER